MLLSPISSLKRSRVRPNAVAGVTGMLSPQVILYHPPVGVQTRTDHLWSTCVTICVLRLWFLSHHMCQCGNVDVDLSIIWICVWIIYTISFCERVWCWLMYRDMSPAGQKCSSCFAYKVSAFYLQFSSFFNQFFQGCWFAIAHIRWFSSINVCSYKSQQ